MGWRKVIYAVLACAGQVRASDSGIPYRPDQASFGLQAGLAYGTVVILLALAVAGMFMLRRRLAGRLSGALAPAAGLRSIASLRLPQQTLVHVIAYRDREILFAQSGDKLLRLGQFTRSIDSTDRGA
jgi:hypothetical protein